MAALDRSPHTLDEDWQAVFENGDKEAFHEIAESFTDTLLAAARKALIFYLKQGHLHPDDLTPEEVVGEALVHAWEHRRQRPPKMGLRAWLLGTEYRVLRGLVEQQKAYRRDKAISLDAPIPTDAANRAGDDAQEWFHEWYQPDAVLTWEDVTPAQEPIDYEINLEEGADLFAENPDAYHVLILHDEFEMALPEVAFSMGRGVEEAAELLDHARVTFRVRIGQEEPIQETDHPATPSGV